jgi:hypothetical protein
MQLIIIWFDYITILIMTFLSFTADRKRDYSKLGESSAEDSSADDGKGKMHKTKKAKDTQAGKKTLPAAPEVPPMIVIAHDNASEVANNNHNGSRRNKTTDVNDSQEIIWNKTPDFNSWQERRKNRTPDVNSNLESRQNKALNNCNQDRRQQNKLTENSYSTPADLPARSTTPKVNDDNVSVSVPQLVTPTSSLQRIIASHRPVAPVEDSVSLLDICKTLLATTVEVKLLLKENTKHNQENTTLLQALLQQKYLTGESTLEELGCPLDTRGELKAIEKKLEDKLTLGKMVSMKGIVCFVVPS